MLAKVLVWLPETRTGDVSEIFLGSPAERAIWERFRRTAPQCTLERCGSGRDFYLAARVRAETAHLLVVNHALLLADLATGGRVLPPYTHLVVDETHRLEEAATEQLTFRVEWPAFQSLVRRLTADGELTTQLRRRADQKRHQAVTAALPELANLASRAGARLEQFASRLNRFVREQESVRQEIGYVQRLALDGAVRSQPNWSQVEIDWEQVSGVLENLLAALADLVQALEAGRWPEADPDAELYAAAQALTALLSETAQQLNTILLAPAGQRRDHVAWLEFEEQAVAALALAPVAVNEVLEEGLVRQRRCAIFTGATLRTDTGFRYIRERLGLWDVKIATVESPFDYKQSTLLYLPADMPLPNQPQYQQAVEQAVVDAVRAAQGRTLVLFTSYQQLRTTADAIRERMDRDGITVLQHGQSSRQRLLREYRNTTRAVLLGTRSFWEGIDLPGEQLSCLLIARLPFAVPNDPLVAARSAEFEDPFQDYTVPDAVIRFRQGFGRLIRRASDRGVVVVLGQPCLAEGVWPGVLGCVATVHHAPTALA